MESSYYCLVLAFALTALCHEIDTRRKLNDFKSQAPDPNIILEPAIVDMPNIKISFDKHGAHSNKDGGLGHNDNPFVINGEDVVLGEYNYQIMLLRSCGSSWCFSCGGSLLSANKVLTAAHCISSGTSYRIAAGLHDRRGGGINPGLKLSNVNVTDLHPKWTNNPKGYPYDIAVLTLETPIEESDYVGYATLARWKQRGEFEQKDCVVTGFGITESGSTAAVLQVAPLYTTTTRDCQRFWSPYSASGAKVNSRHICGFKHPYSSCSGDSGGPLTCNGTVAGVVSWGIRGCSSCFPSVFTRVSSYYGFIKSKM